MVIISYGWMLGRAVPTSTVTVVSSPRVCPKTSVNEAGMVIEYSVRARVAPRTESTV